MLVFGTMCFPLWEFDDFAKINACNAAKTSTRSITPMSMVSKM